jgi:hypothetical protein
VALGTAVLVTLPGSAGAANLAPNPGFETDCMGIPCNWSSAGASPVRDTSVFHGGAASMRINADFGFGAQSDCIAVSPGVHFASAWYLTTVAGAVVQEGATFFSGAGCSMSLGQVFMSANPTVNDGFWHLMSGTLTAPAGTVSARIILDNAGFTLGNVNFDDVVFDTNPTAVTVRSLTAAPSRRGVVVRWRTASEARLLGFNVYRETDGRRLRLNPRLISSTAAGAYRYLDRSAPRGARVLRYWLRALSLDGSGTWFGPVSVLRT